MTLFAKGRPTVCTIDLAALCWNFRQVRERIGPGVKVLSVVKANAYGHGAVSVARALADAGSESFGVATLEEGIELRAGGVDAPILVLAGAYPEQLDEFIEHRLTPAICETETLRRLELEARRRGVTLSFHLKVDTGMGRIGLRAADVDSWLPELGPLKALRLEGIFSHFSHAESAEGNYTQGQLQAFRRVLKRLRSAGYDPPLVHVANSAAVIALPSAHFTMVRPGLMLYGAYPSPDMASQVTLKPVLTWKTRVLQLKKVPKGSSISYGRTFVTRRESLIATLPVGYADGYHRLLSNRGEVLIRGRRAPIVGRVCMDLTMADVTGASGVAQGDEVVLLGAQGQASISADEMARWAETISYEIFTSIGPRVPRRHYRSEGEEKKRG
ncbi:MAG: alanine racemase [Deltaproteobacteria bacterium]|nr:alanine racemase [Deltaproteobacteria bacterium]